MIARSLLLMVAGAVAALAVGGGVLLWRGVIDNRDRLRGLARGTHTSLPPHVTVHARTQPPYDWQREQ